MMGCSLIASAMEREFNTDFAIDKPGPAIRAITPLTPYMLNSQERRSAILSFLQTYLTPDYEITPCMVDKKSSINFSLYKSSEIYHLKDGSRYVHGDGGLSRFFGFIYLKKALENYNLEHFRVVETRFGYESESDDITINVKPKSDTDGLVNIPTINSNDFFSASRYVAGRTLSSTSELTHEQRKELDTIKYVIGFTDICYEDTLVNLIKANDGLIYIIDTAYDSFSRNIKHLVSHLTPLPGKLDVWGTPVYPYINNRGALRYPDIDEDGYTSYPDTEEPSDLLDFKFSRRELQSNTQITNESAIF
jgi:hypothetical protein